MPIRLLIFGIRFLLFSYACIEIKIYSICNCIWIVSSALICNCLRISVLIGRRYALRFLSGNILVSRVMNPILTSTLTDHRHFLGILFAISFIWSETSVGTVIKCRDPGDVPFVRNRICAVKENSIYYCVMQTKRFFVLLGVFWFDTLW